MMLQYDFTGRAAVVTGAAGGMGKAVARGILTAGGAVAMIDVKPEPEDLGRFGGRVQKRKWCHARVMSVTPLKADIHQRGLYVRFVPIADIANKQSPRPRDQSRPI